MMSKSARNGAYLVLGLALACHESTGITQSGSSSATVAIALASTSVGIGTTTQLSATGADRFGKPVSAAQLVWRSADPTIASVTATGAVTGVTSGTTQITVSLDNATTQVDIAVTAPVQFSGGVVRGVGGAVVLDFPPGAVPDSTVIAVRDPQQHTKDLLAHDPRFIPGTAYEVVSTSPNFARSVDLKVAFDQSQIPKGVDARNLRLFRIDGDTPTLVETSMAGAASTVQAAISSSATYALMSSNAVQSCFQSGRLRSPVAGSIALQLSQDFGQLFPSDHLKVAYHTGVDINVKLSTEVHAAGRGVVLEVEDKDDGTVTAGRGLGKAVIVDHGLGRFSLYGHLSEIRVNEGDCVSVDDVIALSGESGAARGKPDANGVTVPHPHLHFEVKTIGNLGDLGNKNPGYAETDPRNAGYLDPLAELLDGLTTLPVAKHVQVTPAGANASLHFGPGTDFPSAWPEEYEGPRWTVASGTRYQVVAQAIGSEGCSSGWYEIRNESDAMPLTDAAQSGKVWDAWLCRGVGGPAWIQELVAQAPVAKSQLVVLSNIASTWTINPGVIKGTGLKGTFTVEPSESGSAYIVTAADIPGQAWSIRNSDGSGSSLVVWPGQNKSFTITYTAVNPVPSAPTNLSATASINAVKLAWEDNSNNEDGFSVERATGGSAVFSAIAQLSANTTSYQDFTAVGGNSYTYRIRATPATATSIYSNTSTATVPATAQTAPDLQVLNGAVSPATVSAGGAVSATWALANQGTGSANASTTVVRISQSATSADGSNLASVSAGTLTSAGAISQSATLTAPTVPGTYYVWVLADNDATSGQSASARANDVARLGSFTVKASAATEPDLQVLSGGVSPSSANAGGTIIVMWTIANQGTGTSNASTTVVRINQSTSVSTGTNLSSLSTGTLAAGSAVGQSATLSAPTTPGTYSVWVLADNNATAGQSAAAQANDIVRIGTFTVVAAAPDLQVLNGSVSQSTLAAGANLSASWTLFNQGTGIASASTTVVRINQSTTTSAGTNLASISTSSLTADAALNQQATINAPTTPGTYYIWILCDNNSTAGQSTSAQTNDIVRIGTFTVNAAPATAPDLQVLSGSVSPSSVNAGGTVNAAWNLVNQGTGPANPSTTVVRVNQSTTTSAGGNVGSISTGTLGAGSLAGQTARLTAPATPGTYYIWVLADDNTSGGQSAAAQANDIVRIGSFTVVASAPDLQILNASVSPSTVSAGGSVSATWTVANQGPGTASASTTVVRINQSTSTSAGSNLTSISTVTLTPGSATGQNATLTAPATPGTYYVWTLADNNNSSGQSTSAQANDIVRIGSFTVTAAPVTAPDVQVLNGNVSPSTMTAGTTVSASWTLANQGTGTAMPSTTAVRVNQSSTSSSGSNLTLINTGSMPAGGSFGQNATFTAPTTPGTYYVWVIADDKTTAGQSTTAQANDIVRIGLFTVTAPIPMSPDLQVSNGSVSPLTASLGGVISVSWTLSNRGAGTASPSTAVLRINQSTTSAGGSNLASINAGSLAAGSSIGQNTTLTAPTARGTYYVWILADNFSTSGQGASAQTNDIVRVGSFTIP